MTYANAMWVVNMALEAACLWCLVRRTRTYSALGVFLWWQVSVDVCSLLAQQICSPRQFSYFYWASHTVTYVLLFLIFRPRRFDTVFGTYWIASLVATLACIVNVWGGNYHAQCQLALCCGALALFATLTGYLSSQHVMLSGSAWLGLCVWSVGQVVAASLPALYAPIYSATCATSLILFLNGLLHVRNFSPDRETLLTRPTLYPVFQIATKVRF